MEGEPEAGSGEMVAIAMRDARTDEILDDVFLEQNHAKGRARVCELAGKSVVQVGIDKNFRLLRGQYPKGDNRRLGGCHVIVPVGQTKGEVLPKISDRRGPGSDRGLGVLQRAGQAHHEVTKMRRSRRGVVMRRKSSGPSSTIPVPRGRPDL